MGVFIHESSLIDSGVDIGENSKIWHFSHIQSGATIGKGCTIGQNVYLGANVKIGNYVKIQNNVSVYEGVEIEDYVFCGPSCVFTNDLTPRARYPKGSKCFLKTIVKHDATLGANCTIVCGHSIGEYAMIAAGATVTKDVPAYAIMMGVPAKKIGYACKCGQKLMKINDKFLCSRCKNAYVQIEGNIIECRDTRYN